MSIRTLIEINHDRLAEVAVDAEVLKRILAGTDIVAQLNRGVKVQYGPFTIIAQRHHSETFLVPRDTFELEKKK